MEEVARFFEVGEELADECCLAFAADYLVGFDVGVDLLDLRCEQVLEVGALGAVYVAEESGALQQEQHDFAQAGDDGAHGVGAAVAHGVAEPARHHGAHGFEGGEYPRGVAVVEFGHGLLELGNPPYLRLGVVVGESDEPRSFEQVLDVEHGQVGVGRRAAQGEKCLVERLEAAAHRLPQSEYRACLAELEGEAVGVFKAVIAHIVGGHRHYFELKFVAALESVGIKFRHIPCHVVAHQRKSFFVGAFNPH